MCKKLVLPLFVVFSLVAASAAAAPGASPGSPTEAPGHAQALSQCSGSLGAFPQIDDNVQGKSADQKGTKVSTDQQVAHSSNRPCNVGALPNENSVKQNN